MGNPPAIGSSRDKCHPQIRYHQDLELQIASQIYSPEYKHQSGHLAQFQSKVEFLNKHQIKLTKFSSNPIKLRFYFTHQNETTDGLYENEIRNGRVCEKSNSNLEREAHEIVGGIGLHLLDLL